MKNILKNKAVIGIMASFLMSLTFCSISYAAPITTLNVNSSSISPTSAALDCSVDVTGSSATVWFEYGQSGSLGSSTQKSIIGINYTPQPCSRGGYETYNIYNLTPNTSYSFRAVSQDISSTTPPTYGDTLTFITYSSAQNTNQSSSNQTSGNTNGTNSAPIVTTNSFGNLTSDSVSLDSTVQPNNPYTDAWFEYASGNNAWDIINGNLGKIIGKTYNIPTNGANQVDFPCTLNDLFPNTRYCYRVVASNSNGTAKGNIMCLITSQANTGISTSQPTVSTNVAIFVRENSALLNGTVNPNNVSTSAWFEWSEDPNVSINAVRTASQAINQENSEIYFSASLSNLILGKTYYFRAVAENIRGTTYGNINQFTTQAIAPIVTTATSTVSTPKTIQAGIVKNNLALEAEFDNNSPMPGKEVIYALSYKNISDSVLKDATLTIVLPNEASYINSSFANVKADNNTLSFKLGNIEAKGSGYVSIKVKITELAKIETISFNSIVAYSVNGKTGKENLVSDLKLGSSSLTASALDILGNIFSNAFIDLILGGLIGAWIYHITANKKKEIVDDADPLK
jgi:hypothetical protein